MENTINSPTRSAGLMVFALLVVTYAITVTTLAATGVFARINTNFFPLTVALATVALTLCYFFVPDVRRVAERLGPYGLASFHVWRIVAALVFLWYGANEWLPAIFVALAGWGDMLAGVLAVLVFMLPRSSRTIGFFHVVGFADFIVAVGTGITLNYIAPESMANITLLPVALIPLIGVPISGATHIAALHQLSTASSRDKS